jgi:hypothetical protein
MIQSAAQISRWNGEAPVEGLGWELHKTKNLLKCKYDFAVQGGAIGTLSLLDDQGNAAILPAKAIVTRAWVDFYTPATSGGAATVALQSEGAGDLLGATAVASCTGIVEGVPTGSAANMKKMSVDRQVKAVIAAAALTAGAANVFIEYVLSN